MQGLLQGQLSEVPYQKTLRQLEPDQRAQVLLLPMGAEGVAGLGAPDSDLAWPVWSSATKKDTEVVDRDGRIRQIQAALG